MIYHKIGKIISKIKSNMNIKFMITFLLLLIIPFSLLINIFIYQFQIILTNKERQNINEKIEISTNQFDEILQEMNRIITSLILNDTVMNTLSSNTPILSYEWFTEYKAMTNILKPLVSNSNFSYQITIIGSNNKKYQSGAIFNNNLTLDSPLLKYTKENTTVLVNRKLDGFDNNPIMTYGRAIYHNRQFLGVILVDINYTKLNNLLSFYAEDGSYFYVIYDNNKILYSTDSELESAILPTSLQTAITADLPYVTLSGKEYLLMKNYMSRDDFSIVALVDKQSVFKESSDVIRQFIFIFYIIIAITVIGIRKLTTHFSKNIRTLNQEVSQFGINPRNGISTEISSNDEVGQLADGFITMSKRINHLLDQIKEVERNKGKLEYQALQAQINPHMIYNTLNTITYLAQLQNISNIEDVSSSFAKLLHLISNNVGEYITIENELEYIQSFVSIKKYNLICNISTEYQIDPDARKSKILKLLLQPIIENAMVHGFSNITADGLITIRIRKQDNYILIDVIDNGNGMSEEHITRIINGQIVSKDNFNRIGIYNIIQRLNLQYGDLYKFDIISYPSIGTTIHIEYPTDSD